MSDDFMPQNSHRDRRRQRLTAAREKGRHTADEWASLKAACGPICVRCGCHEENPVKDHIISIYMGGSDAIENIQPLCHHCNSQKGPESVDHRPPSALKEVLREKKWVT